MNSRKKLIEVAVPLDDINTASAREKSIRHGHPSTIHLWWARRPLAACRAVIFASMVDDPSSVPEEFPTSEAQAKERERLFEIIRQLVVWENSNNGDLLSRANTEIRRSWLRACTDNARASNAKELFNPAKLPALHDPFAGGGAIPLEAQKLGLESFASDINPVAVLINKSMIEIPPKFINRPPVFQGTRDQQKAFSNDSWKGIGGLTHDIAEYGQWVYEEAEKKIGKLYPQVEVTKEMVKSRPDLKPFLGQKLRIIAWLWARTVRSPNPAFSNVHVPLISSFYLSTKKGNSVWVEPIVDKSKKKFSFAVRTSGKPKIEETIGRTGGLCIMSGSPIELKYIRAEGKANRLGTKLMAMVAESKSGRIYLDPSQEAETSALEAEAPWSPELEFAEKALGFRVGGYGFKTWADLFTQRQLVALSTFSGLIKDVRKKVIKDAVKSGVKDDGVSLAKGGSNANAYADAIALYLSFAIDRMANTLCTIARWTPDRQQTVTAFSRQAVSMSWDFPEVNPFADAAGDFLVSVEGVIKGIPNFPVLASGYATQANATNQNISSLKIVSTDPPYYDNIGYADLSDFFYVWLRNSLKDIFPDLLLTISTPKDDELVATPFRHGGKEQADEFFLKGMTATLQNLAKITHPSFPMTIFYAFKQTEETSNGTVSTGWETFLEAVIKSGLSITGTWPMRTELSNRMRGTGSNALASSVVLVCRKRPDTAKTISRREYVSILKKELSQAVGYLQECGIAASDLAQSAIGPGMAIFSRYKAVLEADDTVMSVRSALILINQVLDEALADTDSSFDSSTRWAISWFEQHGFSSGPFGEANVLAQAKNVSLDRLSIDGVVTAKGGKVSLLATDKLPDDWDPKKNKNAHWSLMLHLIKSLENEGEVVAGQLLKEIGSTAFSCRELAYRCFSICEKNGWAKEGVSFNNLVSSWNEIQRQAVSAGPRQEEFEV